MCDELSFTERVAEKRDEIAGSGYPGSYGRVEYTTPSEMGGRLKGYVEIGEFFGSGVPAVAVRRSDGNRTVLHLDDVERIVHLDDPEEDGDA